ncbi:M20 family metallo-hydrolase [Alkalihalobacterium elongatum]|uniref:M20 family metallo-hydrolase n=1 Tax=Alkalihalobacterium elongatum TaxID=2675466 RepID=UPI001C200EF4|nr:M20 family metallo-hydrolase [Alkalihalobacterium elongatum]
MKSLEQRIEDHIEKLAQFTETPTHGVTRVVYTEHDTLAKEYIKNQMHELGLKIAEDEIGNIFGTWEGVDRDLSQVWTGSHLDAPTHGGKYDGVVGVFGALEAIRLLQLENYKPKHDIVLVIFASEEPTRFGVGCLGSRALTGMINEEDLEAWIDKDHLSLKEVLVQNGCDPKKVLTEQLAPEKIKNFIELHVEQGAVLETEHKEIGIVDVIAAPTDIQLIIYGEQRHAGSTPMSIRKDPMPAAAEVVLLVEHLTKNNVSETSVGTVGKAVITPGASNVIPERIEMTIDIRDIDAEKKKRIISELSKGVTTIMAKRELSYQFTIKSDDVPSRLNKEVVQLLKESCDEVGCSAKVMASGAYHDALIMSRQVPANMIFVPSQNGISHAPTEFTATAEIVTGIKVLARTIEKLSQ